MMIMNYDDVNYEHSIKHDYYFICFILYVNNFVLTA